MKTTPITAWFTTQGWQPQSFQKETWQHYTAGKSGLLNAATGSGKTYALWGGILAEALAYKKIPSGLNALWITPLRALAVEIQKSTQKMTSDLMPEAQVGLRTGDTPTNERTRLKKKPPFGLVTTPESLHLLLSAKAHDRYFKNLKVIVVDEWHELIGSKRGVQIELAIAYLKSICPELKVWGISATIGNLPLAREILFGKFAPQTVLVQSLSKKKINVKALLPKKMERFPWRGHIGLHLLPEVIRLVKKKQSTLLFTNTRAQCEIWFQKILETAPEWAGQIAMHHGSMDKKIRLWVEEALRNNELKLVVCTSSLDLGVDFSPVENCIQIGSPKGVGRFLQRAGRSGHQPGAISTIYFLPTHAMELIEAMALQKAIKKQLIEDRIPYIKTVDVAIQFLMTLAIADGFDPDTLLKIIRQTFCYQDLSNEEWQWMLNFLIQGSQSLEAYDEYKKALLNEEGKIIVTNKRVAMRHRMSIGTIVSDTNLRVKYFSGGYIGTIEEWFISKLKPGDVFTFAGRNLELVRVQQMDVLVRKSKSKKTKVPSWMGGRMSLSAHLSDLLRQTLYQLIHEDSAEIKALKPVLKQQQLESIIPTDNQFLIETFATKEGYHAIFYPFEGRAVHEAIAGIIAYRLSLLSPTTFTMAFNDYGFELLSDQPIDIQGLIDNDLFTADGVVDDLKTSVNISEMARRKFRDIAVISGLVFQGYPDKPIKSKHLQSGAQLFYEVFKDYEPDNLLYQQALLESYDHELEQGRLIQAFERIEQQNIHWANCNYPTPFSFPLITDRLREKISSETLENRIRKMYLQIEKATSE